MSEPKDDTHNSGEMRCSPALPDRVGVWRLTDRDGEVFEFDVYELPTGHLCAWCEEVGLSGGTGLGHVPVCVICGARFVNAQHYGSIGMCSKFLTALRIPK
jgi:hypothetical protein